MVDIVRLFPRKRGKWHLVLLYRGRRGVNGEGLRKEIIPLSFYPHSRSLFPSNLAFRTFFYLVVGANEAASKGKSPGSEVAGYGHLERNK